MNFSELKNGQSEGFVLLKKCEEKRRNTNRLCCAQTILGGTARKKSAHLGRTEKHGREARVSGMDKRNMERST